MKRFLQYLSSEKRVSKHTLEAYERDLQQFLTYLKKEYETEDPSRVDHFIIRSWMVSLLEEGMSRRSVNRKLSTLRSYYRYCRKNEGMKNDPMGKVVPPKQPDSLPEFVDPGSMEKLFQADVFEDSFKGIRDRTILEVLYGTGIRRQEAISLKEKDVDLRKGGLKVLGKRNKERVIPITDALKNVLQEYLARKKEMGFDSPYLLVTDKGEKLYEKFVYRKVDHYLGMVSTMKKRSPHVIRHTFATHLLGKGADLNAIKELLGHADLAATQVYTHNSIEQLKDVYKKAHPKGGE